LAFAGSFALAFAGSFALAFAFFPAAAAGGRASAGTGPITAAAASSRAPPAMAARRERMPRPGHGTRAPDNFAVESRKMPSMSARTWAVLVACGLLTVAAPAGAQDAKTRAEAKEVEKEAQTLYDKGEYAEALAKYERLDDLIPLKPAQKVRSARCVEKLGRLLEAQDRYTAIAEDDTATSNRADLDAREAAKNALGALQRRIPKVIIQIEGADRLQKVDLELDGEPLQQSKVGTPLQLDPGEHTIKGSLQRGKELDRETASARFDAKENTTLDVPLSFAAGAKKKQDLGGTSGGGASQDYWAILKRKSSTQRTLGWVVVGVGGAVFLAGGATTLIALGVKSSLDDQCTPERQCPPAAHSDVDSYDTLQTVTTVLFVGGAIGVGTGIALLMTAPDSRAAGSLGRPTLRASARPSITPWIGLGGAGVRGSF